MGTRASMTTRLDALERQLQFVMQTLSLTKHGPNGQTDARSLAALYQEMTAHAGSDPQTFADVARRAFAEPPPRPDPDFAGPDGFSGTEDQDKSGGSP
jgi:hypothetical protein